MEALELYAKEWMEVKEKFAAIGFELIGTKSETEHMLYFVKEKSKS